jgi:hypothetical protein
MASCNVEQNTLDDLLSKVSALHDRAEPSIAVAKWIKGFVVVAVVFIFSAGAFSVRLMYALEDAKSGKATAESAIAEVSKLRQSLDGLTNAIATTTDAQRKVDEAEKKALSDRIGRLEQAVGK